ncbi:hypothetical protein GCM10023080_031500 [Streptomyces pseudoechinosporeus]
MAADTLDRTAWAPRRAAVAVQALNEQRLRARGPAVVHYQLRQTP